MKRFTLITLLLIIFSLPISADVVTVDSHHCDVDTIEDCNGQTWDKVTCVTTYSDHSTVTTITYNLAPWECMICMLQSTVYEPCFGP